VKSTFVRKLSGPLDTRVLVDFGWRWAVLSNTARRPARGAAVYAKTIDYRLYSNKRPCLCHSNDLVEVHVVKADLCIRL
jgi:hypothetical protein